MLKGKSFVRDLVVLLLLILTIKYAYQLMHSAHTTSATCIDTLQNQAHETTATIYNNAHIAKIKPARAHLSENVRILLQSADQLIKELNAARTYAQQDVIMRDHDKDILVADIKTTISQIEHIIAEFEQDPTRNTPLLGPAESSTRVVFERSLQQKLALCAQEAEVLFIRLYNELQGTQKPLTPALSLHVCIQNIKKLHTQLA